VSDTDLRSLAQAAPAERIAVGPTPADFATAAVQAGGARVVGLDEEPDGVVWHSIPDLEALGQAISGRPSVRWVQLPSAGVEKLFEAGVIDRKRLWTCAKGAYAEPVAEHALTLALAGLRQLKRRSEARAWGEPAGVTLFDAPVVILGAGGITVSLLELLRPFRAQTTVVRRRPEPVDGAARTVALDQLDEVLADARVVVLALSLSPQTVGVIGPPQLARMRSDAWLVNVARGRHVQTDALVDALREGQIGGAALDVTDPEPLPEEHPLWRESRCLITPHTADTLEMVMPLLARRITENVRRLRHGEAPIGVVDPDAGY
jgi:phosphoglycerate dehydrogenase-like enzyme